MAKACPKKKKKRFSPKITPKMTFPYTVGNPPSRIKSLPTHAISIWVSAFNSALDQYKDEGKASAVAWAAVKRDYKKVGDKWVKKASEMKFAVWTTAYVNDLPDSAFAYIMPGGKKDDEGKTVPRGLRKLPYKDKNGKVDLPHLRNALARAPQTKGIPAATIKSIQAKLRSILEKQGSDMITNTLLRNLSEIKFEFAEGQKTSEIQVLPFGKWKHPTYGSIKILEKDLVEFVKNFEGQVRKELPITEGHSVGEEEKPAIGWFKKLENKGRDGLWALIEWTKEGLRLIKDKAYKYFSPEFYSVYEDPETHEIYHNVLVGGALTNRPYFKGLQAVMFSEFTFDEDTMTLEELLKKDVSELTDEEKKFLKEHADELTDEQKETYKDILEAEEENEEEENEEEDEEEEEKEKEEEEEEEEEETEGSEKMVQMSEKSLKVLESNAKQGVKAMAMLRKKEAENYVSTMTFSEENRNGTLLPKSRNKVVAFLLSLTEGQQKEFKDILAELPKGRLFSELGEADGIQLNASEQILKLAEEKMSKDKELKLRQATDQVLAENPELAKRAEEE